MCQVSILWLGPSGSALAVIDSGATNSQFHTNSLNMAEMKRREKYDLGAAVDKELVFDFPFLLHDETVSYIQEYGKVMFILRGPPSTGKATLSEMIQDKHPHAAYCCADQYFHNSFESPIRNKDTLKASHVYCKKKATSACKNKVPTILVQNTHMKKWEMQPYLDLAAMYNYTVIMAITLYRFNVTPEALLANSTDGLDIQYFRRRLLQWEDNPPFLTGWFLGPSDTLYLQNAALEALQKLIGDGKFCRVFDVYDADQIANEFRAKDIFYCIAGHSTDQFSMKKYYLSSDVQDVYGKCFSITILGYHVTSSNLNAIVKVDDQMQSLLFEDTKKKPFELSDLELDENLQALKKTSKFVQNSAENYTAYTEEWEEDEDIDTLQCSFICLAQRENLEGADYRLNIETARKEFKKSMNSAADNDNKINNASYTELESNINICRLQENEWLIKADKKIVIKTIFTGFYP